MESSLSMGGAIIIIALGKITFLSNNARLYEKDPKEIQNNIKYARLYKEDPKEIQNNIVETTPFLSKYSSLNLYDLTFLFFQENSQFRIRDIFE